MCYREQMQKLKRIFVLAAMCLCLSGCGGRAEGETEGEVPSVSEEPQIREIPVDFPFYGSEAFRLTLVSSEYTAGEYVLLLCDEKQQLLQQIPCGQLMEPVTFSYDHVAHSSWRDLEIFPDGSGEGLLFLWKDKRFSEQPIQIPRYAEIRGGAMLTVTEEGAVCEKRICQLNECKGQAEEVRSWSLDGDNGRLRIWDCLRGKSLFDGNVLLDGEGEPLNREYYEYLFWENRSLLWDYSGDPTVRAWLNEKRPEGEDAGGLEGFETVQNQVFGNMGHTAQYESRQAFLESCGYAGEEPIYQYYDRFGELQLELFLDEENQRYFGISYLHRINSDREKVTELYGFTVCNMGSGLWEEGKVFSLLSVYGSADLGKGGQELVEYTESGKPDYVRRQGPMEDCGVEYLGDWVTINYIYREDGTLFCRDYHHDALTFGSTLCSLDSFFDEKERLVYETGYITHGSCEYYYIYEDEGNIPACCLCLDYNGGYAIPYMVRFR